MIVRGWHIDGFGVFNDRRSQDLGPGLTVLHGPNEAGKSTLLAFIRGVLFGFPDKRSRNKEPLYPPVNGGTHGGRLFLEHEGQHYTVERRASSRNASPVIRTADGNTLPEGELSQLLGGADGTLFRNVFGFSLWELQGMESLTEESVRDRIFSGAVAGAGRDARQAAKALEDAAGALYWPDGRRKKNRVSNLLQDLKTIDADLASAREAARAYPEKVEAEREAERRVAELRDEIDDLRERATGYERLIQLWSSWCDRDAALQDLERMTGRVFPRRDVVQPDSGLADLARRADKLRESLELQRQRLTDAAKAQQAAAREQDSLDDAMARLGDGWDEDRVAGFRLSIRNQETVRAWETELSDADAGVDKADQAVAAAERDVREARETHDRLENELDRFTNPPPDEATLTQRQAGFEDLQAKRTDLGDQERDAKLARDLAAERAKRVADLARQQPRAGGMWLAAAAAVAALLAAAGLWFGIAAPVAAGILVAVGLGLVGVAAMLRRRRTAYAAWLDEARAERDNAEAEADTLEEQARGMRASLLETARALDFDDVPNATELTAAQRELRYQLDRRRQIDAKAREVEDAAKTLEIRKGRLEELKDTAATARETRADVYGRWQAWKADEGFPPELSPQGVRDFAQIVVQARTALKARDEHKAGEKELRDAIDAWEDAARAILEARGAELADSGEPLILAFNAAADAVAREQALFERAVQVDRQVFNAAGNDGERAAELRAALSDGDEATWQRELATLKQTLTEKREAYDNAVGQLRDARNARQDVEQSNRIAELEISRNRIGNEIAECYRRWQVLEAAEGLIQETLDAYERDRQPEVFRRASDRLAFFSEGRYLQIRQDEDGQSFAVLDADNRLIRPLDLSRGTREQLYLAVRLGLIEEFMQRGTSLPLIMDEVLVNFDPVRMAAVVRELARFAESHQVLMFTCHPEIAERVREHAPNSQLISMAGSGTAAR